MSKTTQIEIPGMSQKQATALSAAIYDECGIVTSAWEQDGAWRLFVSIDNWLMKSLDRVITVTEFAWDWLTSDEQLESIRAKALAVEDFELFEACETATKMIVQPNLKREAVAYIMQESR